MVNGDRLTFKSGRKEVKDRGEPLLKVDLRNEETSRSLDHQGAVGQGIKDDCQIPSRLGEELSWANFPKVTGTEVR